MYAVSMHTRHCPPESPPFRVPPLKTLPLHLCLGRRDRCRGIRINEPAPVLAVLELGGFGRTHADAAGVGAAARGAVGVVDAPARDELGAVALADVARARVIGLDLG